MPDTSFNKKLLVSIEVEAVRELDWFTEVWLSRTVAAAIGMHVLPIGQVSVNVEKHACPQPEHYVSSPPRSSLVHPWDPESRRVDEMKVVYIAGPFTGATAWDIEQNVRRAEEAALEVAGLGAMPLCPHTNSRFFYGQNTPEFWYEGTMELLRRCDAILLLPDWQESKGCIAEEAEAKRLGLPRFPIAHYGWRQRLSRFVEEKP